MQDESCTIAPAKFSRSSTTCKRRSVTTVKPVALVADAIKDCSKRGDRVLDPFGGSGTTLIAAHKTGRSARLIEFDPAYCDTILKRFERLTGKAAILEETGDTFEAVHNRRGAMELAAEDWS